MLRAAAIFSDNMVLQRNKKLRIFGTADTGSKITVSLGDKKAEAICFDGKWMVYLPEFEACDGLTMIITDEADTIHFENIAIGEVWLAGGQSNMELELQNAEGGQKELAVNPEENTLLKKIRFYYTPKVAYVGETLYEEEEKSHWELFGKEEAAKWSAVGFFYAKELARELDVTVGIIGCNWGGTSASAWMSREALMENELTCCYAEEYETSDCVKKSEEEQIKDYEAYLAYHANWEEKAAKIYEKEPMIPFDKVQEMIGICQYPGPMNCANFTRPYGLYESMIKRIAPYTLRGFLYYQAESDEHRPESYYTLFTRLIRQWREDWEDDNLPFLMVQLPMHRYQHDPDTKSWCILREAQMKAYKTVKNTGIAVIIDCGEFHEIHPKNKKPVGERLALQAFSHVYDKIEKKDAFGPLYRDFLYRDGGMEITFDYAQNGFVYVEEVPENAGGVTKTGFEIAGADGIFYPASVTFSTEKEKANTIFLSAENVKEPLMARYLWTNYGEVTLFGGNGLPTAPFRTHLF